MKKIVYIISIVSIIVSCSVDGLLETSDTGTLNKNSTFADRNYTRQFLNNLYGSMRSLGGSFNAFSSDRSLIYLEAATDNGMSGGAYDPAAPVSKGTMTSSEAPLLGGSPWTYYYRTIRMANIYLFNVDSSPLTDEEKAITKVEARFLRALYYHELFRWHGEVLIVTDTLAWNDFGQKRNTLAETVNFIIDEFNAVAAGLPVAWANDADYGRATKGMALGYKARTMLYAASPLNGGIVSWADAAQAAWDVINLTDDDGNKVYELYIDAEKDKSFARFFNQRKCKENILSFLRGNGNALYSNLPGGDPWNAGGTTFVGTHPTQNLVDAFDMKNGMEPVLGYDANNQPIINVASGYNLQDPYKDRDPRMDMTVIHHGSPWTANGVNTTFDMFTASLLDKKSGYILRKFLDDRVDHRKGGVTAQNFPMMRYAEILLNYAEAKNMASGPSTEIIDYINLVRDRAGVGLLDNNPAAWTKESLNARIQKERRVELAFEEHRFFDVRRWYLGREYFGKPVYKIIVEGTSANPVYSQGILESRPFPTKMYRMPVPMGEVSNCPDIWQNPGW